MKIAAFPLLLIAAFIFLPIHVDANNDTEKNPQLIVIKYDAEWCHACRELDKITPALHKQMADDPVLFLTLDITDEEAIKQSSLHAAALGIQEDYKKMEGRTGLINVLDAKTKKRLTQLNMTHTAEEMASMIREHMSE
jgi:thiol-disulfide isomerase/thioredoxin